MAATQGNPATSPAGPPRVLRVLVVDDEPGIRLAVRIVLERRGHQVLEAGSAAEGLECAETGTPDVALVDLRLPGNGLDLLHQLDAIPALVGRTVLMTGSEDLLLDAHGRPVWPRWIAKPFDFATLAQLVEGVAAGHGSTAS